MDGHMSFCFYVSGSASQALKKRGSHENQPDKNTLFKTDVLYFFLNLCFGSY